MTLWSCFVAQVSTRNKSVDPAFRPFISRSFWITPLSKPTKSSFGAIVCSRQADVAAARALLVEMMADIDEGVAELFLMEEEVLLKAVDKEHV